MGEPYDPMMGRGAWTTRGKDNGSIYYAYRLGYPKDGAAPADFWHECVQYGVFAIQRLLRDLGHRNPMNGVYGYRTARAVKRFQRAHGISTTGIVGSITMTSLMTPHVIRAALAHHVPAGVLYGIGRHESGFDPGAQGRLHPPDLGLWQENTDYVDVESAMDPVSSAERTAFRLHEAMKKYSGKGNDLRLNCAIAQHNSPLWADQWFSTGQPPNSTIEDYVESVKGFAATWTAI